MAVTVGQVVQQLDLDVEEDLIEVGLPLLVAAANEWVASKVSDTEAADKPNLIQLATTWLVGFWWEVQRGRSATTLVDVGDEVVTINGVGFAVPNKVTELIESVHAKPRATYSFPDAVAWPDSVEYPAD